MRGTRRLTEASGFSSGSPKRSPASIGVKMAATDSSALSSTGISTHIALTRSGASLATVEGVFAPSEVPPITACSMPRWSSRPTTCWPKKVIE